MARAPAPIYDRMEFPDYSYREYPKMLYAYGGKTITVESKKEEEALGPEWAGHPRDALTPYVASEPLIHSINTPEGEEGANSLAAALKLPAGKK